MARPRGTLSGGSVHHLAGGRAARTARYLGELHRDLRLARGIELNPRPVGYRLAHRGAADFTLRWVGGQRAAGRLCARNGGRPRANLGEDRPSRSDVFRRHGTVCRTLPFPLGGGMDGASAYVREAVLRGLEAVLMSDFGRTADFFTDRDTCRRPSSLALAIL